MAQKKTVKIACKGADQADLAKLVHFQGGLKTLTEANYIKFRNQMLKLGFSEPISVWNDKGKLNVLNGHQRLAVLRRLEKDEGYEVPKIPINFVEAKDITEAKKKVLALTSSYGDMTTESLGDFLLEANLDLGDIAQDFRFLDVELEPIIDTDFSNDPDRSANTNPTTGLKESGSVGEDHGEAKVTRAELSDQDQADIDYEETAAPIPKKAKERCKLGDVWQLGRHKLICGDSSDKSLVHEYVEKHSGHSIVTDPPYGLSFMGKKWDASVPSVDHWKAWISRAKPGAHVLSFSGTRTYHRMAVAMEDAGLDIFDMISWCYGQGFPKSHNISKAIDKTAGVEREKIKTPMGPTGNKYKAGLGDSRPGMIEAAKVGYHEHDGPEPATPEAKQWDGWGSALKPAMEPVAVAQVRMSEKTIAANVLKHGTGGLNIDGCRIGTDIISTHGGGNKYGNIGTGKNDGVGYYKNHEGRFPANLILDEDAADELDRQSGESKSNVRSPTGKPKYTGSYEDSNSMRSSSTLDTTNRGHVDSGGASRFFYVAKASKSDKGQENTHATVKPLKLMQYLVRLVTPPGGLVLEPWAGSGTTILACEREGFSCIGFELDPLHCDIILHRFEKMTGEKATKLSEEPSHA